MAFAWSIIKNQRKLFYKKRLVEILNIFIILLGGFFDIPIVVKIIELYV